MKQWLETRQVMDQLAAWHAEGTACALATVIRVQGSAYRHEGAKLVVAADGRVVGNVSGGCLEEDVREVAIRVIRTGTTERREYCGSMDEISAWDLGVGCEGVVELFIERVTETVGKLQEAAKGDLAQRQEAIKTLVEPLKTNLHVVRIL